MNPPLALIAKLFIAGPATYIHTYKHVQYIHTYIHTFMLCLCLYMYVLYESMNGRTYVFIYLFKFVYV